MVRAKRGKKKRVQNWERWMCLRRKAGKGRERGGGDERRVYSFIYLFLVVVFYCVLLYCLAKKKKKKKPQKNRELNIPCETKKRL